MAAPNYATNLSDVTLAASTTGFTAIGGGGSITAETDFSIQDTTCISKATSATWDSSGTPRGGVLYNAGTGLTIPTDGAVLLWIYWWGPGVLATKAAGGVELDFGNATTAYYGQYVSGVDDWIFGGWRCYPVDPNITTRDRTQGSPNGTWQYFGWQAYVAAANSIGKGNPYGLDAIRYGRCDLVCTNGDLANGYATFLGAADWDNVSTRRLGLLIPRDGAYYQQGLLQLGSSGTSVDFRDANRAIFIQNTEKVSSNFNKIEIRNSSSRVDWTSISMTALGTVARGNFEVVDNADVNFASVTFTDMGTFAFLSNSTILNSTFRRCNLITAGGATFTGCTFANTNDSVKAVTASSPANAALITNSVFESSGTKHGLEITGTAANITLTNITWTGYAGSDGSSGNEAVYVNISTGSMNLTISGGTTPSVRTAGCAVTVISGAVNVYAYAVLEDGSPLSGARVHLEATSGGPFPYNATVTISNSGTTATVTHTSHGLATNDKVVIRGASLIENLGVFTITKINDNSYSYTMASSPGSSPTGTITSTFVVLSDVTGGGGSVSMSRVFPSAQPVIGRIRKSSSAPFYKNAALSGTVSSTLGATFTGVMISDD